MNVREKRQEIKRILVEEFKDEFPFYSNHLLYKMFELYAQFFPELIPVEQIKNFRLSWNTRRRTTAGCIRARVKWIEVAEKVIRYNEGKYPKKVQGLICNDKYDAVQLIMEHELLHFFEFQHYGSTNCGATRYKQIALMSFGHTKTTHDLDIVPSKRRQNFRTAANSKNIYKPNAMNKFEVQKGQIVKFKYRGCEYSGTVVFRGKIRATVNVITLNGSIHGFRVPYSMLYV